MNWEHKVFQKKVLNAIVFEKGQSTLTLEFSDYWKFRIIALVAVPYIEPLAF